MITSLADNKETTAKLLAAEIIRSRLFDAAVLNLNQDLTHKAWTELSTEEILEVEQEINNILHNIHTKITKIFH
jgi:hypothetical protein